MINALSSHLQKNFNWVSYSSGTIYFTPPSIGTYTVSISLSDEDSTVTQNVTVLAKQRADLVVQSVEIRNLGTNAIDDVLSYNSIQTVEIFVKNTGASIAQPVSVRCSVDGQTVDNVQIALISPGEVVESSCEWIVAEPLGMVDVSIEVDWTLEIEETNEENNILITTVEIGEAEQLSSDKSSSSDEIPISTIIWISAMILAI